MSNTPFISICLPAFEKAAALERLLKSISIQQYKNFEVIVTDDSRNDAVEKIVAAFQPQLPVQYFRNSPSLGMAGNWNAGIQKASADWIKIMHDDDWFATPASLEKFAEKAAASNSGFIASASYQVHTPGEQGSIESFYTGEKELLNDLPLSLFYRNTIGSPSVTMFKKDDRLLFDKQFRWVIDIDFYVRYMEQHNNEFEYINEPLICITRDENQVSASCARNPAIEIPEYFSMLHNYDPDSHLRNKYAFYCVWELMRKFAIKDTTQLKMYTTIVPAKIEGIIRVQKKIPRLILKQTPWNRWLMKQYFSKFKM